MLPLNAEWRQAALGRFQLSDNTPNTSHSLRLVQSYQAISSPTALVSFRLSLILSGDSGDK